MSHKMRFTVMLSSALLAVASMTVGWAADSGDAIEIGKQDDFMFHQEMKVGDATIPPGHYRFQHRTDGSEHYVKFVVMKGMNIGTSPGRHDRRALSLEDVGEVKCRVEPLDGEVKATTIRWTKVGDAGRINRIEVKGETVAHIF